MTAQSNITPAKKRAQLGARSMGIFGFGANFLRDYRQNAEDGFIKGKSAIHMARVYSERKRNFTGQNFWARGYFVSTVGRDEELIRNYILH